MDMRTPQVQRIKKGRVHKIVREEKVPHPRSHGATVITLAILFDTQQQDGKRTHAVYSCHGAGDCARRARS